MSRYQLPALPQFAGHDIAIGWDRVGTFFAYVFDRDADGEDVVIVNIGDRPGEITNPQDAIQHVRPYAAIPADARDLAAALHADARHEGSISATHRT